MMNPARLKGYDEAKRSLGSLPCLDVSAAQGEVGACVTDASTLMVAARWLTGGRKALQHIAQPRVKGTLDSFVDREVLITLLQNVILFDRVLVDYTLLSYDEALFQFAELLEGIATPLYLSISDRVELLDFMIKNGKELVDALEKADGKFPLSALRADYEEAWKYKDIVDEFYRLEKDANAYLLSRPAEVAGGELPIVLPKFVRDSSNPESRPIRTAFYMAVGRLVSKPLCLHPLRTPLISAVIGRQGSIAINVVEKFEKEVLGAVTRSDILQDLPFQAASVSMPPIGTIILERMTRSADPIDVLLTFRNSRPARRFRDWCRQVEQAFRAGPGATHTLQRLLGDADSLLRQWSTDLDEGVRYKTRKLGFAFGSLFKINTDVTFKDPILWTRQSDLILLNDLARSVKLERVGVKMELRDMNSAWSKFFKTGDLST